MFSGTALMHLTELSPLEGIVWMRLVMPALENCRLENCKKEMENHTNIAKLQGSVPRQFCFTPARCRCKAIQGPGMAQLPQVLWPEMDSHLRIGVKLGLKMHNQFFCQGGPSSRWSVLGLTKSPQKTSSSRWDQPFSPHARAFAFVCAELPTLALWLVLNAGWDTWDLRSSVQNRAHFTSHAKQANL